MYPAVNKNLAKLMALVVAVWMAVPVLEAAPGKVPITVNGDTVEFLSEGREVTAEGHVEIEYEDSVMRCDKVRVFIDEKLVIAEGRVFFSKEAAQEIRGEMIIYDFGAGTGTIVEPDITFPPYFGKASLMEKISDTKYVMSRTKISTCDLPHPHFALHCSSITMNPEKNMEAKDVRVNVGDVPVLYLPYYSQELRDDKPKLMIIPGYEKEKGMELFGSYRYYLNDNARGVLHADWYQTKGFGKGVDLNYNTGVVGTGNLRYYHITQESTDNRLLENEGHRSRVEMRHRWSISPSDDAVLDFFRSSDGNFRKDYFEKEYDKVPNPLSFFQYTHAYPNATLSVLSQPRVNFFDTVLQKLPEAKLETVNQKIIGSPLYFKSTTTADMLSQATALTGPTIDVGRVDTSNQLSLPFKLAFLDLNPFAGNQETYYSRGVDPDQAYLRTMFFTGVDISTRFYKMMDLETDVWGLDIHRLRHIVIPSIQYRYQHTPSVDRSKFFQLDSVDGLDLKDLVTFALENKVQTKRRGETIDVARLIVSSDYNIERNATTNLGFANFKYDLELRPYSWLSFDSDADFDLENKYFRSLNTDAWGTLGRFNVVTGYRFKHSESSQLTTGVTCSINPFWTASAYERFEFRTGNLVEQEYRLSRDMHCWVMEWIFNHKEGEGVSILVGFKLKAFPGINVEAQTTVASPPRTR